MVRVARFSKSLVYFWMAFGDSTVRFGRAVLRITRTMEWSTTTRWRTVWISSIHHFSAHTDVGLPLIEDTGYFRVIVGDTTRSEPSFLFAS